MMISDFYGILESTGLPVAYLEFPEDKCPDLPFIVYQETGTNNFFADDTTFKRISKIQVDLLSVRKDFENQFKLEQALTDARIPYNSVDTRLDNEFCHRATYTMEVIING